MVVPAVLPSIEWAKDIRAIQGAMTIPACGYKVVYCVVLVVGAASLNFNVTKY